MRLGRTHGLGTPTGPKNLQQHVRTADAQIGTKMAWYGKHRSDAVVGQ